MFGDGRHPCRSQAAGKGQAESRYPVGTGAHGSIPDDRIVGVREDIHDVRHAHSDATRPTSYARGSDAIEPSAAALGNGVKGAFNRATRPPSWSTATNKGNGSWRCGSPCKPPVRRCSCSGDSTLRPKTMTPPQ